MRHQKALEFRASPLASRVEWWIWVRLAWDALWAGVIAAWLVARVTHKGVLLLVAGIYGAAAFASWQVRRIRRFQVRARTLKVILDDVAIVIERQGNESVRIERAELTRITRDEKGTIAIYTGVPPTLECRWGPLALDHPAAFEAALARWAPIEHIPVRFAWVPSPLVLGGIGAGVLALTLADGPAVWLGWVALAAVAAAAAYYAWYQNVGRWRRARPDPLCFNEVGK